MEAQSSHPTSYDLDCYNVQALDADRQQEVGRHVETCEQCRTYLAELDSERDALHEKLPARPFARVVAARAGQEPARPVRRLPAWGFALAAVLVLAVLTVFLWRSKSSQDTVRTMGDLQVNVFIKRNDQVKPVVSPATVTEGDAVRIHLVSPRPAFVAVFFIDEAGEISWYHPASGSDAPLQVPAGETILPESARFDASPHDERAFVVHAPETFVPGEAARSVQAAWKNARSAGFAQGGWLEGLEPMTSVLFVKE